MKGGTIRRIANTFKRLMGRPVTTHHKDPVMKDPRDRRKKRAHGVGSGRMNDVRPMMRRGRLGPPKCEIGTITFHDKLVRHFGARKARKMGRMLRLQPELLKDVDFSAHPPWAHLNKASGTG